jgi:hypothetical protein
VTRVELLRQIRAAARTRGLDVRLLRQGSEHELWEVGPIRIALPRHRELTLGVERAIKRHLEQALGRNWWQG